jgi:molybdopterin-binding protein
MKVGARNQILGKVTAIKKGDVMSLIKFTIPRESRMAAVVTTESLNEMKLRKGDQVGLFVKAVHVLPVTLK